MAMNKTYEVSNRYHDYKDYTREYTEVGRSIPRLDGPMKVTGKLQYTDDIKLPRMVSVSYTHLTLPTTERV